MATPREIAAMSEAERRLRLAELLATALLRKAAKAAAQPVSSTSSQPSSA